MPNPSLIAAEMTDQEYQRVVPEATITQKALQDALEAHQTKETSGLVSQALQAKEKVLTPADLLLEDIRVVLAIQPEPGSYDGEPEGAEERDKLRHIENLLEEYDAL